MNTMKNCFIPQNKVCLNVIYVLPKQRSFVLLMEQEFLSSMDIKQEIQDLPR